MTVGLARSQNMLPPMCDEGEKYVSQALRTRRSVRAFSSQSLDDFLVCEILQTALAAPSWGNVQPYQVAMGYGTGGSVNSYKPGRRKLDELLLRSSTASD
jgi:hypothetical protein